MELDGPRPRGNIRYILLLGVLLVIAGALAAAMVSMLQGGAGGKGPLDRYRLHMALVCLASLGIVLVALGWMLARYAAYRVGLRRGHQPTLYADAWSASGKRFQLQEKPDEETDKDEGEEE